MAEEEAVGSLFQSFPDITEDHLVCLRPLPSGEQVLGDLYRDLFGAFQYQDTDTFTFDCARMRAALAQVTQFQLMGYSEEGKEGEVMISSMQTFASLYQSYCATVVKRFWKAKRPGASVEDRVKFTSAVKMNPMKGATAEEDQMRRELIEGIVSLLPSNE